LWITQAHIHTQDKYIASIINSFSFKFNRFVFEFQEHIFMFHE